MSAYSPATTLGQTEPTFFSYVGRVMAGLFDSARTMVS